jgi:hypothetical protein
MFVRFNDHAARLASVQALSVSRRHRYLSINRIPIIDFVFCRHILMIGRVLPPPNGAEDTDAGL